MVRVFTAFDSDHVGAEIGQQPRAAGAGEHVSKVEDADAGKRRRALSFVRIAHELSWIRLLLRLRVRS